MTHSGAPMTVQMKADAIVAVVSFIGFAERHSDAIMYGAYTAREAMDALAKILDVPANDLRKICE